MAIRFLGNSGLPFFFEDHGVLAINFIHLDDDMVVRRRLHYFATVVRLNR